MTILLLIALAVCLAYIIAQRAGMEMLVAWMVQHGCPIPSKAERDAGIHEAVARMFNRHTDRRKEG